MDLIEALSTPPEDTRSPKPRLDVWMEGRTPDEQEALKRAAVDPAWMHTALRRVLIEAGAPSVSPGAVAEWRTRHGWKRQA